MNDNYDPKLFKERRQKPRFRARKSPNENEHDQDKMNKMNGTTQHYRTCTHTGFAAN